jgi:hypothetical protein
MAKPPNNSSSAWDSEVRLLIWLATCASVLSFLFYYQRGEILLYGDAVAHINIARRVFDSLTPGPLQLGTVWLPLPHLLMLPFLISTQMWQRGLGGSIPSMAAYVFGVVGIFRLVRGILVRRILVRRVLSRDDSRDDDSRDDDSRDSESDLRARAAAWTAALIYAANPNLIYLQTTAMGEALYLAFFIWSVVYFSEFIRGDAKELEKCGFCLFAACLTRYDGWFLAAAMAAVIVIISIVRRKSSGENTIIISHGAVLKFVLIAAAAPALWLTYNGVIYRNLLEFENGPYSAKAIERKTQTSGNLGHPGSGNLPVATLYFLKSAEDNVVTNQWLQRTWLALAALAVVLATISRHRRLLPLLFLLVPLPFYGLSVAYGGVPIFVPQWWPFSHYNVRYGLQLLPGLSVALSILMYEMSQASRWSRRVRSALALGLLAFVALSYGSVWRADPITLKEAELNMRGRNHLEDQLASVLLKVPSNATLLMYLGDHVGALQKAGIPLRRVINEGNRRVWKQPTDIDGLWERALADPAHYAEYAVGFEGDPVWEAAQKSHLSALIVIHVTGQARAALYATGSSSSR